MKQLTPDILTPVTAKDFIGQMAVMKFFPADAAARGKLIEILMSLCEFEYQADWLVNRMIDLYGEWPGAKEMRACYCSKFKPADGREESSQVYLDGIPSETGRQEFEPAQLSAGEARKLLAQFAIVPKELPAGKPDPNPKAAERSLAVNAAAKAELSDTDKTEPVEVKVNV